MAFELEKAERCQICGTADWEWEGNRFAFELVEKFCQGCYTMEYMQDATKRSPGVRNVLEPTGTPAAARRELKAQEQY